MIIECFSFAKVIIISDYRFCIREMHSYSFMIEVNLILYSYTLLSLYKVLQSKQHHLRMPQMTVMARNSTI